MRKDRFLIIRCNKGVVDFSRNLISWKPSVILNAWKLLYVLFCNELLFTDMYRKNSNRKWIFQVSIADCNSTITNSLFHTKGWNLSKCEYFISSFRLKIWFWLCFKFNKFLFYFKKVLFIFTLFKKKFML